MNKRLDRVDTRLDEFNTLALPHTGGRAPAVNSGDRRHS
jgi:hypothetical protein